MLKLWNEVVADRIQDLKKLLRNKERWKTLSNFDDGWLKFDCIFKHTLKYEVTVSIRNVHIHVLSRNAWNFIAFCSGQNESGEYKLYGGYVCHLWPK